MRWSSTSSRSRRGRRASGLARGMIGFRRVNGVGDQRRPRGLRVGTQAANTPSVRLYERSASVSRRAQFVLHHHGAAALPARSAHEDRIRRPRPRGAGGRRDRQQPRGRCRRWPRSSSAPRPQAGAQAVKFQTIVPERLVGRRPDGAPRPAAALRAVGRAIRASWRAPPRKAGVMFLSTPFDLDSVAMLDAAGAGIQDRLRRQRLRAAARARRAAPASRCCCRPA